MKTINVTFEDTDFEALETCKEELSGVLDKKVSWEKLILYLLNNQQ